MILRKKEALDWLYSYARTDEQLDFLYEGERRQREEPDYDVVREYVLTFPCPPEFMGFVTNDFVFVREKLSDD